MPFRSPKAFEPRSSSSSPLLLVKPLLGRLLWPNFVYLLRMVESRDGLQKRGFCSLFETEKRRNGLADRSTRCQMSLRKRFLRRKRACSDS